MRTNPYPDEPTMEDLQPKASSPPPPESETTLDADSAEVRLEEARTVRYAIGKLNDFLQWFMLVLEVTLAIRFVFKLIGALPSNPFAGFLYSLTNIVLFPFLGIVTTDPNARFAAETLIAMGIYWLIFWGIRRFMHILITGPEETTS